MDFRKPKAYVSIPKHVSIELSDFYLEFLTDIGFECTIWNRNLPYDRNIMNNSDVHFILYDFNTAKNSHAENGYLPKGCYEESNYAKNRLKIDSYLIYLPVSKLSGVGFFNYSTDDSWPDSSDYVNYVEINFKKRQGIIELMIKLFKKYNQDIKINKYAIYIYNAYQRFLMKLCSLNLNSLSFINKRTIVDHLEKWVETNKKGIMGNEDSSFNTGGEIEHESNTVIVVHEGIGKSGTFHRIRNSIVNTNSEKPKTKAVTEKVGMSRFFNRIKSKM